MNEIEIAFLALIIAGISMFISLGGIFLSKRSYDIVNKEHADKYNQISSYLIEAIKWFEDDKYYCSFAIAYTNSATIKNSLTDIVLEVDYYDDDNTFNKIKISPEQNKAPIGFTDNYKQLNTPINLAAKDMSSGWITFRLPMNHRSFAKIDVYRLCAKTPTEEKITNEVHILRTVSK